MSGSAHLSAENKLWKIWYLKYQEKLFSSSSLHSIYRSRKRSKEISFTKYEESLKRVDR